MFLEMQMNILFDRPIDLSIHKINPESFDIVEGTNGEEYSFNFAEIDKEVDTENPKILHLKMRNISSKAYVGFVKDALEDLDFFMDIRFITGSKYDPEIHIEELLSIKIVGTDRSFLVEEEQKCIVNDGRINMSEKQERKLIKYLQNMKDKNLTDDDIFDISEELKISTKKITYFLLQMQVKGTPCEGCKHIGFRFPPSMYPCADCKRIHTKDYYEEA
ncbi:MAG: hypothetical protein IJO13_00355 [Lachnospiraceae bacterium]|nr:hypothetical protein [Lachnospiraceae bacterium]